MSDPGATAAIDRARAKRQQITAGLLRHSGLLDRVGGFFYEEDELQALLEAELVGEVASGPIRTRSKVAKQLVCEALGYVVPSSFGRTRPRFPAQDLDVYVQRSNNLQIWNEEIDPYRRFVLLRVDAEGVITRVRVANGETIARLDRTGTLTGKYQAKRRAGCTGTKLVSEHDTDLFTTCLEPTDDLDEAILTRLSPVASPVRGQVLSIAGLQTRLLPLVGTTVENIGDDQERNRGAGLHRAVCAALGLGSYADTGQFPDITCQGLEVKLQTASTIDLGLVTPDSEGAAPSLGEPLRHCDVRYLVAFGDLTRDRQRITINEIVLVTGEEFFTEFQAFGGLTVNRKLQIPLPTNFFD